ncbi:MAG: heavy-metal-associated domain-containing protein [Leptolyngbya sp. SIO4C1]|nr:heavy-metal-associated domain-containing protein [Leptolyngbya sp. SIO4C1]
MKTTFKVPSMACSGCVDAITKVIKTADEQASVDIDLEKKTVQVDSEMSEASVRQAIVSSGHTVE